MGYDQQRQRCLVGVWSPGNTNCPISNPCTWTEVLGYFPDIRIHPTLAGVLFKAGSGWTSFDVNVDQFSITISGITDTYNFENLPVNNITQGTAHPTIQDAVNNATAGDVLVADPGTYPENVIIDKSLTLRGAGNNTDPITATLDGQSLTGASIRINAGITNVTIEHLRVEDFDQSGIYAVSGANSFTAQYLELDNNGFAGTSDGGLYLGGPIDTVLIDHVTASKNQTRGIVIWNGHKTNITITKWQRPLQW